MGPLRLVDEKDNELVNSLNETVELDFIESMGVSWIFVILKVMYVVLTLMISLFFLNGGFENYWILDSYQPQRLLLTISIAEVVFFPIFIWVYVKVWNVLIIFFTGLFGSLKNSDIRSISNQIVNASLSSHVFLIIPVFGGVMRHISGLIYIYLGLRNNLGFSRAQGLLTLISPLLIIGLFGLFFFISIMLLTISTIF
jgi:hypothetical protein